MQRFFTSCEPAERGLSYSTNILDDGDPNKDGDFQTAVGPKAIQIKGTLVPSQ